VVCVPRASIATSTPLPTVSRKTSATNVALGEIEHDVRPHAGAEGGLNFVGAEFRAGS
jgi:hypothetical protein